MFAITDGIVVRSERVSGYGGMTAIRHQIHNEPHVVIYGHLDPSQLLAVGETVSTGEQIGVLGDGFTTETDNERKHLHFAIYKGTTVNVAGYVQNERQLSQWLDPQNIF